MKRFLIFLLFTLFTIHFVHAHVEKGYNLVGGITNIGLDSDRFTFGLTPDIGWFVKDRLAVGGQLFMYLRDGENSTSFIVSMMPFGRYYFGKSKTKVFIHGAIGIGIGTYWSNFGGEKTKISEMSRIMI